LDELKNLIAALDEVEPIVVASTLEILEDLDTVAVSLDASLYPIKIWLNAFQSQNQK
jgi:hypothetical protein